MPDSQRQNAWERVWAAVRREAASAATWRSSSELDPFLAVFAGQRVEAFLKESIERLIAGLATA